MTIRTILVDDEPLATQGLRLRLEAHDDVEIVATAANGREAIRAIKTHKPDLVFLDIQMPGLRRLLGDPGTDGGRAAACSCSSPPMATMPCARSRRRRSII